MGIKIIFPNITNPKRSPVKAEIEYARICCEIAISQIIPHF